MTKALNTIKKIEEVVEKYGNTKDFDAYESVAIAILDSEFNDYPEGVLQEFLQSYLKMVEVEN